MRLPSVPNCLTLSMRRGELSSLKKLRCQTTPPSISGKTLTSALKMRVRVRGRGLPNGCNSQANTNPNREADTDSSPGYITRKSWLEKRRLIAGCKPDQPIFPVRVSKFGGCPNDGRFLTNRFGLCTVFSTLLLTNEFNYFRAKLHQSEQFFLGYCANVVVPIGHSFHKADEFVDLLALCLCYFVVVLCVVSN